jgi:HEAT repeats
VLVTLTGAPAWAGPEREAQIEDVETSLVNDQSYKVRVEAALVLGRLHQIRSIPVLISALKDPSPAVRATAVRSLGLIGSPLGRDAVTAAQHDGAHLVRQMAREALRRIDVGDSSSVVGQAAIRPRALAVPSFDIKPFGDPGNHAGPALRSHIRDVLISQLRPFGDVASGTQQGTYAVDGVIKSLDLAAGGRDVEVTCAVQLVVSRQPGGGVFMMTTGTATVQKPRRQWRPQLRASMELEALEAALRGASEGLVKQLGH